MPVGSCLNGNKSCEDNLQHHPEHHSGQTSHILNMVEQFAFMQHTLLLQIFRLPTPIPCSSGSNHHGASSFIEKKVNNCPTCVAFSELCCQNESGRALFYEFLDVNTTNYLWDCKLGDAIQSMRYQGYICPGILVTMTSSSNLEIIIDAWKRRVINSPTNTRITQVGLSGGCTIKPVLQSHCISLPDILCLILAKLKGSNKCANIDKLCSIVESDWAGSSRTENLRETIHSTLGQLIKQRRVYYTGNSGYFLVDSLGGNNSSTSFGNRLNRLRHSLRISTSPPSRKCVENKECQTSESKLHEDDTRSADTSLEEGSTSSISPSKLSNLERSQSLRLSKKSVKSSETAGNSFSNENGSVLSFNKGGSLRLSKKEMSVLSTYQSNELGSDSLVSVARESPKIMDRKNSFLGKLFSKNKIKQEAKPEIGTFSAQFPPPELLESTNTYQGQQSPNQTSSSPHLSKNDRQTSPIFQIKQETQQAQLYSVVNKGIPRGNIPAKADSVYKCPPPPLPYRPPHPPNPYSFNNTQIINVNQSNEKSTTCDSNDNSPGFSSYNDYHQHSPKNYSSSGSSSSGPSSVESQPHLYNRTLVVIEKSNSDLEHTLKNRNPSSPPQQMFNRTNSHLNPHKPPRIDTIHNNRNLTQEVIYEVESVIGEEERRSPIYSTNKDENPCHDEEKDVLTEEETIFAPRKMATKMVHASTSSDYPSLSDLNIKDMSNQNFKSLTAQKLMAGLSFNSIDTLLEVNAAAEVRNRINESTETIDFGVI
uniref:Putative LOC100650169 [Bombus terrestris] n=1 Tax=Lepeophtheirus salmonis TaxID=72036 RepID=A0A0K2T0G6_LEPSM